MKAFPALAESTRLHIVEILAKGELSAGEISAHFHASGSAISQHLKVLKAAKLVRVRAEAQRRIYALNSDGLAEIDQWLVKVRTYWTSRIDAHPPLAGAPLEEAPKIEEALRPVVRPSHDLLRDPFPRPD